jgi:Protein of unknown function (DUF4229)
MSPAIKYAFARIGLFLVCAVLSLALLPRDLDGFLKLMIALLASLVLSYFLLRTWRDQAAERIVSGHEKRVAERQRLRAALAGEDDDSPAPTPKPRS